MGAIHPRNLPNRCQVSDGGGPVVDKGDMGLTVPGFSSSDAAASGAELRTRGSSQSGEEASAWLQRVKDPDWIAIEETRKMIERKRTRGRRSVGRPEEG